MAPEPFFSPRGTPLSVYYRTLVTAELGVAVDLLTYGQGQDVVIPGVQIIRIPGFASLGRVKVGPSYLKLFLDAFLVARMIQLLRAKSYDFVHAHEEAIFFCLPLQPIFGFRLVYDMHSSLPQQLTNFRFTRSRLLIGLFQKLEDAALRSSDAVITICQDLYDYAGQKIEDRRRLLLIENSIFDPILLPPSEEPSTPQPPASVPEGKRLVVYTGTLEPYQGIDLALRAFKRARAGDAHLLVAGGTPQQVKHYTDLAARLGILEHCSFTGSVPKSQASAYISQADVLLSPRTTGTNTPLKIYELLASGIPIVATDIYSHTQVLTKDVAFLIAPEPEALADGILQALERGEHSANKAANARALYQEKYARAAYKQKMEQVLEAVC